MMWVFVGLLAMVLSAVNGQSLNTNIVRNPGAESGRAYWVGTGGYTSESVAEKSGTYVFNGANHAYAYLYQDIFLAGVRPAVSQGAAFMNFQAKVGGFFYQNDRSQVQVLFLSISKAQIGESANLGPVSASDRQWRTMVVGRDTYTCAVPENTYYIRVYQRFWRSDGGTNDGFVDDISVVLRGYRPVFAVASNLIAAPGAENGYYNCWWSGGVVRTNTAVAGRSGSWVYWGGPGIATKSNDQWVDVRNDAVAIDAGGRVAALQMLLGGTLSDRDDAQVQVFFFSSKTGAVLGSFTVGPVSSGDRAYQTKVLARSGLMCAVPKYTRYVKVRMHFRRFTGTTLDAFVDQLDLRILPRLDPPPATYGSNLLVDHNFDDFAVGCYWAPTSPTYLQALRSSAYLSGRNGAYMLQSPPTGWTTNAAQWIDVRAMTSAIAAGAAVMKFTGSLGGWAGAKTSASVSFYTDKLDTARIATDIMATVTAASARLQATTAFACAVPKNTRYVRFILTLAPSGTLNAAADYVQLRLEASYPPIFGLHRNLLRTPGVQYDYFTCWWTKTRGDLSRTYINTGTEYSYVFGSASAALTVVRQRVDVTREAPFIDSRLRAVVFSGLLGGASVTPGSAAVNVVFRTIILGAISTALGVPVTTADRGGLPQLLSRRSAPVSVPRGTRYVDVEVVLNGVHSYGDDFGLELQETTLTDTLSLTDDPTLTPLVSLSLPPSPTTTRTVPRTGSLTAAPTLSRSKLVTPTQSLTVALAMTRTTTGTSVATTTVSSLPTPSRSSPNTPSVSSLRSTLSVSPSLTGGVNSRTSSPSFSDETPTITSQPFLPPMPTTVPPPEPSSSSGGSNSSSSGDGSYSSNAWMGSSSMMSSGADSTGSSSSESSKAATRTASRSLSAEPTTTMVPPPPPTPAPPELVPGTVASAGEGAAAVAGVAGALAASPAAAAQVGRVVAVLFVAEYCGRGALSTTTELPFLLSPTGLGFGPDKGKYYRGAVLGNVALIAGAALIAVVIVGVFRAAWIPSLVEAAALVLFPSCLVVVAGILLTGVVLAGFGAALSGGSVAVDIAVFLVAVLLAAATMAYAVWFTFVSPALSAVEYAPVEASDDPSHRRRHVLLRAWRWLWSDRGVWRPKAQQMDRLDVPRLRMHALLYDKYRGKALQRWLIVDLLATIAVGLAAALAVWSCAAAVWAVAVLLVSVAFAAVAARPYLFRLKNIVFALICSTAAVAAVLVAVAVQMGGGDPIPDADETLLSAAAWVVVACMALIVIHVIISIAKMISGCSRPQDPRRLNAQFADELDAELRAHGDLLGVRDEVDVADASAIINTTADSSAQGDATKPGTLHLGEATTPLIGGGRTRPLRRTFAGRRGVDGYASSDPENDEGEQRVNPLGVTANMDAQATPTLMRRPGEKTDDVKLKAPSVVDDDDLGPPPPPALPVREAEATPFRPPRRVASSTQKAAVAADPSSSDGLLTSDDDPGPPAETSDFDSSGSSVVTASLSDSDSGLGPPKLAPPPRARAPAARRAGRDRQPLGDSSDVTDYEDL